EYAGAHHREDAHELAALDLEAVARRFDQFVPFDFDLDIDRTIHRRTSAPSVFLVLSAAIFTARTIRGYVPQRQTLRSMMRAMSASDGVGLVRNRLTVAITIPGVQ